MSAAPASRSSKSSQKNDGWPGDAVFLVGEPRADDAEPLSQLLGRAGLRQSNTADRQWRFGATIITLETDSVAHAKLGDLCTAGSPSGIGRCRTNLEKEEWVIALAPAQQAAGADRAAYLQTVQQLFAAAALVSQILGMTRLFWPPAQLWSPTSALVEAIAPLERSGIPPVLHLIAFLEQPGIAVIQSRGLAYFCGIELALAHDGVMPPSEVVRRLARLCIHAMVTGPMQPGAVIAGMEPGETLSVGSANGASPPVIAVQLARGR
jgi:hypothetical protein